MKTSFLAFLFVPLVAFGADAVPNAELAAVQAQLNVIQQQEQSLFQQFQMLQELRRLALQSDIQTMSYEERVQAQSQKEQRASDLVTELNDRYRAYRELEDQKAPLVQRLLELSRQP